MLAGDFDTTLRELLFSPPTPAAGRTLMSKMASNGFSSRREASIGPLTDAVTVYPQYEKVAEPSAFGSMESSALGIVDGDMVLAVMVCCWC